MTSRRLLRNVLLRPSVLMVRKRKPLPTEVRDLAQLKAQATYDDFASLDIRIGKVVEVQSFARARNPSYKVGVDVGADRIMWSRARSRTTNQRRCSVRWLSASAISHPRTSQRS